MEKTKNEKRRTKEVPFFVLPSSFFVLHSSLFPHSDTALGNCDLRQRFLGGGQGAADDGGDRPHLVYNRDHVV